MSDAPITISGGDELGNSGPGWPILEPESSTVPSGDSDEIPHVCAGFGEEIDWWQPDEFKVTHNEGGHNATGF